MFLPACMGFCYVAVWLFSIACMHSSKQRMRIDTYHKSPMRIEVATIARIRHVRLPFQCSLFFALEMNQFNGNNIQNFFLNALFTTIMWIAWWTGSLRFSISVGLTLITNSENLENSENRKIVRVTKNNRIQVAINNKLNLITSVMLDAIPSIPIVCAISKKMTFTSVNISRSRPFCEFWTVCISVNSPANKPSRCTPWEDLFVA